jgi:thymidylate kinase
MIVAIIGADGSGKSTLARQITSRLCGLGIPAVVEKRFEEYFLVSVFLRVLGRFRSKLSKSIFFERTYKPSKVLRFIWTMVLYFDFLLLYLYLKLSGGKKIQVCDRYAYSYLVTWEYYDFLNPLAKFLYRHFPQPDLLVFLSTDAETGMRRKLYQKDLRDKEYTIEFFKKHVLGYEKVFKDYPGLIIDGGEDTKLQVDRIVKKIIPEMEVISSLNPLDSHPISHKFDRSLKLGDVYSHAWAGDNSTKLEGTLSLLSSFSKSLNMDILLFKSFPPGIYPADDLDLCVKTSNDFETLSKVLEKNGFSITHRHGCEAHFVKEGHLMLDVHYKISWDAMGNGGSGPNLFDLSKIFRSSKVVNILGNRVRMPSPEDEIAIVAAHSVFQHHYTTLGEVIYIGELIRNNKIDWDYLKNLSWNHQFEVVISIVEDVYKNIWDINLGIPKELIAPVSNFSPKMFYHHSAPEVLRAIWFSSINDSPILFPIGVLLAIYRYFYYVSVKNSLPFNHVQD